MVLLPALSACNQRNDSHAERGRRCTLTKRQGADRPVARHVRAENVLAADACIACTSRSTLRKNLQAKQLQAALGDLNRTRCGTADSDFPGSALIGLRCS